jgi:hypothetical protein
MAHYLLNKGECFNGDNDAHTSITIGRRRRLHMKRVHNLLALLFGAVLFLVPELALAAGGKASALVVVADTRRVTSPFTIWILNTYNTDPFMLGIYCAVFVTILGVSLGLTTDFIMKRTGLDLTSRKIVEH